MFFTNRQVSRQRETVYSTPIGWHPQTCLGVENKSQPQINLGLPQNIVRQVMSLFLGDITFMFYAQAGLFLLSANGKQGESFPLK